MLDINIQISLNSTKLTKKQNYNNISTLYVNKQVTILCTT